MSTIHGLRHPLIAHADGRVFRLPCVHGRRLPQTNSPETALASGENGRQKEDGMTLAERDITTLAQPAHPHGWDGEVVGPEGRARLADGSERRFVSLDNAATTPALTAVQQAVLDFLPWYSSVHRGTGFKSRLSTAAFEQA